MPERQAVLSAAGTGKEKEDTTNRSIKPDSGLAGGGRKEGQCTGQARRVETEP